MATQSRQAQVPPFLLTRPAAQAGRFADQLRQRFGDGIRLVHSPLLAARFLSPQLPPGPWAGVIFTSETGVHGFRQVSAEAGLACWCVGDRTAESARAAGFAARSAGGNAADLVAALSAESRGGTYLYARGRDTAVELANALTDLGFSVLELVVYEQVAQPLAPEGAAILSGGAPVVAPLFSARTAALLAADPAAANRVAPLWIAALSPAVAQAAGALCAEKTAIAHRPDAEAMLDAIAGLIATGAQP